MYRRILSQLLGPVRIQNLMRIVFTLLSPRGISKTITGTATGTATANQVNKCIPICFLKFLVVLRTGFLETSYVRSIRHQVVLLRVPVVE